MKTIWKFDLGEVPHRLPKYLNFDMPRGAKPLHVGLQAGHVCLWAEVNPHPDVQKVPKSCLLVGTGQPNPPFSNYVGTLLLSDTWVVHVFLDNLL